MANIQIGKLPNMRRLITPDPGFVMVDMDLSRADAQVVAWESGDVNAKQNFKDEQADPTKDTHSEYSILMFGEVTYQKRQYAKVYRHGWSYGATDKTLARQCNLTISQAAHISGILEQRHPDIKSWHRRVKRQLETTRCVYNAFGYRIFFFDRPDSCFNEALAWCPQSTVGHVINLALCNIAEDAFLSKHVRISLQNHDSLVTQIPIGSCGELLPKIKKASEIVIPYSDPLIIPTGFKLSMKSWGDCKEARLANGKWEVEESKDNWVVYH